MRRLVTVSLVTLLLLSGCIGTFDPGSASTPKELDPAEADLPPGVNESGVTSVSALITAHNKTLRAEGFVLNGTFIRYLPINASHTYIHHTVVAPDSERFYTEMRRRTYTADNTEVVSARERTRIWGNSSIIVQQFTLSTNTTISKPIEEIPKGMALTQAPIYESFLNIGAFSVARVVSRDGHTFTTLVANDTRASFNESVTFTARFVIDERGIIHEAVVDIDWGPNAKAAHLESRIVTLGASPDRPDWVANALDDQSTPIANHWISSPRRSSRNTNESPERLLSPNQETAIVVSNSRTDGDGFQEIGYPSE